MTITRRPYQGQESDTLGIAKLLEDMPPSTRHLIDLPWRLSSPACVAGQNACLWEDENSRLLAFAAWQIYWATLDLFIAPGPQQRAVEAAVFAWADERFRELDQERGKPLPYWVQYRNDDLAGRQRAEAYGFSLDEERYVQFQHPLANPLPEVTLSEGFILRPLAGEQEAEACAELQRAAFNSTSMTADWRARALRMPSYRPELDLVIVAPGGELAGFCLGWFDARRRIAQVEPIGVHPRYQSVGLSRALLPEMLRRFKALGAEHAIFETDLDRTAARHAYESVGFHEAHRVLAKGKWV
jgi:ribosomal protein S18 acetylase RimI-like enzyme